MNILVYTPPYPTSSMDNEAEFLTRHLHQALVSLARPHVDTQSETNNKPRINYQWVQIESRLEI